MVHNNLFTGCVSGGTWVLLLVSAALLLEVDQQLLHSIRIFLVRGPDSPRLLLVVLGLDVMDGEEVLAVRRHVLAQVEDQSQVGGLAGLQGASGRTDAEQYIRGALYLKIKSIIQHGMTNKMKKDTVQPADRLKIP